MAFEPDEEFFPYRTIDSESPSDDLWCVRWRVEAAVAGMEKVEYFPQQAHVDSLVKRAMMTREGMLPGQEKVHIRGIWHMVDGEWIEHEVKVTTQYNVRKGQENGH